MKKDAHLFTMPAAMTKLALLLALTAFLSACGSAGNAVRVADPAKTATHLNVQADYTYYYDGQKHMPFTIVGLKKSYTLATKYFTAFDPGNGALQSMIERLHTLKNTIRPVLLEIVDADGKVVGFVYTSEHQLTVRLGSGNTVYLDAPYSHGSHAGSLTGN